MNDVPAPAKTRAILVGIERYALGEDFALPGAVADALQVADTLEHHFGVPADRIELMLSPLDEATRLDRAWKPFTITGFQQRITTGLSDDDEGGMLFVYWSGHGAVYRPDGQQYLIAAEADSKYLRSFRFNDISNVLVDANHAKFSHQVLVVDACKSALSSWSRTAAPSNYNIVPADADPHHPVQQCQLFACSLGQPGLLRSDQGSVLTNAMIAVLEQSPKFEWPDFETAFRKIRDRVETSSKGAQTPVVSFASGWDRGRFSSSDWMAGPSLHKLIADVGWTPARLRAHAMRSVRGGAPSLADLDRMIAHLSELPEVEAVPPLGEFIARIVREADDEVVAAPLRAWFEKEYTPMQRAAITERLDAARPWHLLQLWYEEQPPGLKAALFDSTYGRIDRWGDDRLDIGAGGIGAAIGAWMEKTVEVVGEDGDDPVIELCLPSAMLGTDASHPTLHIEGQDTDLDEFYAVILRSTDRLKNRIRRREWLGQGPGVLQRVGKSAGLVRWADKGATRATLLKGFLGKVDNGPVWVGITDSPAVAGHGGVLDICFAGGLPALFWMRPRLEDADRADAEVRLKKLLGVLPEDLPRKLRDWRREEIGYDTEKTALLFDDPQRVPPWATPSGAAGAMKG